MARVIAAGIGMVLAGTAAAAEPMAPVPAHPPFRDVHPARALAGTAEAGTGLPAAGLRLRGASPLPGLLLQRRSRPVRLEPICRRARSGARGRDRRAGRLVRQLTSGCATRPRSGGRQPAAAHRGRHCLRRRPAQPRPGPRAVGRLGGRPWHRGWRVRRPGRDTGGGPSVSQHRRATLPGYRRRALGGVSALQIGLSHPDSLGLVLAFSPVLGDPAITSYLAASPGRSSLS